MRAATGRSFAASGGDGEDQSRVARGADRERVVDGLSGVTGQAGQGRGADRALEALVGKLAPRWFVTRNVHAEGPPVLVKPRYAMSYCADR